MHHTTPEEAVSPIAGTQAADPVPFVAPGSQQTEVVPEVIPPPQPQSSAQPAEQYFGVPAPQKEKNFKKARRFMFATGIECSCPIVGDGHRIDEMQLCGHYDMWERDMELVHEMGIGYLRYGPPDPPHVSRPGHLRLVLFR